MGCGKQDCMPIDCKHIKMLVVAMVSENFTVAIADSLWSYYVFLVRWELKMIIAFSRLLLLGRTTVSPSSKVTQVFLIETRKDMGFSIILL